MHESFFGRKNTLHNLINLIFVVALVASMFSMQVLQVRAAGHLTLEIIAAPNLVVDSNALSPSTYSPQVATVIARICNTGDDPVNGVTAYIGNYTGSGTGTPGIYPTSPTDPWTIGPSGTQTTYTGFYSFTHLGGTADAVRFMGTLAADECRYQYWSFEYPLLANGGTIPTWGSHVQPDDDLYLDFDMWVGGDVDEDGAVESTEYVDGTHRMHMRNEISAMANKIKPNGNPPGEWFNTDSDIVYPGQTVTTNGILYRFGNVNQGFDNGVDTDGDGIPDYYDGVPDYNAWIQPFGDPAYDPSCFRLVSVTGVLTVTRGSGNPDMIIPIYNNLYFSDLPADNTDVRGEVFYEFLALGGACTVPITPYQEVASGFDNEKFNGDYGTGVPSLMSYDPEVILDKNGDAIISEPGTITYNIPFYNDNTEAAAGLTLSSDGVYAPLMIEDTIPEGLAYVNGQTGITLDYVEPDAGHFTIYYSTDSGLTWSINEPADGTLSSGPNSLVVIRWVLEDPLPANPGGEPNTSAGTATFQARVPDTYSSSGGDPFIENCAETSFGDAPAFDRACAMTIVEGTGTIGDFVWRDEDNNGQQTGEMTYGINGVTVSLYWDRNSDGELDDDDMLLATQDTYTYGGNPGYYQFTQVPPGDFLVVVDGSDVQAQYPGYRVTTPDFYAVTLGAGGSYQTADFGFGPSLEIEKQMLSASATCGGYEGHEVRYSISLTNNRPGTGETIPGGCRYALWSSTGTTADPPKDFTDYYFAFGEPDDQYAYGDFSIGANRWIQGTGFDPGTASGTIDSVQAVFRLYVNPTIPDDSATLRLLQGTTVLATQSIANATLNNYVGQANAGYVTWTIPGTSAPGGSWTWDDFAALSLELQPTKSGGGDDSDIYIDAIGFYVDGSGACPAIDDNDIMTTVPLTDTFDTTYLEFVSADPSPSAVNTSTGVITWSNVGPIYPGETRTVYVRFLARALPGTASVTVNNAAGSTGTRFADSGYANDVHDTASGTICQTGSINGYVYSDPNSSGWNYTPGAGDLPIPEVQVTLYGCYHTEGDYEGELITLARAQNSVCTSSQNAGEWRVVDIQSTDAAGYYAFNGLLDGFYYAQVNAANLPGTVAQTAEADDNQTVTGTLPDTIANGGGNNNSTWGNPAANLRDTAFNPINSPGETISGVNFGYHVNPGVYGSVWEDNNGDGDKDDGEGPIGSVTAQLRTGSCSGTVVGSTATTSDGRYQFGDLTAGTTYYITVDTSTLPGGASAWTQTGENDGSINNCIAFTAVAGTLSGSHDFGFRNVGDFAIGDTLYYDWDGDGTQDTNEEGIPNITVWLYEDSDANGVVTPGVDALIETTTSDGDGFYQFTNLPADNYLVVADTADSDFPASVVQTQDPDETGLCQICDSRGRAALGPSDDTVDFGYQPMGAGTIGDTVYRDMNGDGVQGLYETGIAGITVWLEVDFNNDGTYSRVMATTTDANGNYLFPNLPDATYRIVVDTTDPDLPEDTYGHSYVPSTGTTTDPIIISGGNTYLDADFGFVPLGAIGDFVWQDSNGDGLWENGEVGIPGVVVELYEDADNDGVADGAAMATATTDAGGLYLFSGLDASNYIVRVADSNFASGGALYDSASGIRYLQTYDPDAYTEPCSGTQCDDESWVEGYYTPAPNSTFFPGLQPGQSDMGSDFGYQPPAIIGDFIWQDFDGDGVQDPGEPGIGGVTVNLYEDDDNDGVIDAEDALLDSVTTNSDGYYDFTGQPAGNYIVQVDPGNFASGQPLDGYNQTGDPEGDNNNIGDADTTGNVSDLTNDFGYRGSRLISGTIFFDRSTPLGGLYESGSDAPFSGVVVYLYDSTGALVGSTTTNNDGYYEFNIPSGTYTIRVAEMLSTRINGLTRVYEPDGAGADDYCGTTPPTCDNGSAVDVTSADATDQDFGYFAIMDMDDLPGAYNYNVLMEEEGPMHINTSGGPTPSIFLGTLWDAETDGIPDSGAGMNNATTGDDLVGIDDEDGVDFLGAVWRPGTTVGMNVTVVDTDTSIGGYDPYLVVWVDWNLDGDFRDAGEQIVYGELGAGTHTLQVDVPSYAGTGLLNIRFRLYATQTVPSVIAPTGSVIGGEVEAYQINNTPTSVNLASFDVIVQANAILLTWETASELDNLGFNIYRSDTVAGPYTKLNDTLIPTQNPGSTVGAVYTWLDTAVQPGVTYYYQLEDVDVKGVKTLHGPVNAMLSAEPTAVNVQSLAARSPMALVGLGLLLAAGAYVVLRKRDA